MISVYINILRWAEINHHDQFHMPSDEVWKGGVSAEVEVELLLEDTCRSI